MEAADSSNDEQPNLVALQLYLDFLDNQPRPRLLRDRSNPIEDLDEIEFRQRFRLHKDAVTMLLSLIGHGLLNPTRPATKRKHLR